jgi:hypothetical protein
MADIGSIVRGVISYSSPGASDQQNVLWWVLEDIGMGNPALLAAIAEWVTDLWAPAWALLAADTSTLLEVAVDLMNEDGTVRVNVGVEPIGIVGNGSDEITSAAVSGYLLAQTDVPNSRGSKYVPGIDESKISAGLFSGLATIDLLLLASLYVTGIPTDLGGLLAPGILSRAVQIFRKFLVSATVTDVPAYQRRRKPNVGS